MTTFRVAGNARAFCINCDETLNSEGLCDDCNVSAEQWAQEMGENNLENFETPFDDDLFIEHEYYGYGRMSAEHDEAERHAMMCEDENCEQC
jgi:hypothetical protein